MAYRKTTEQFIRQAKEVHDDLYDYLKVKYETALRKVKIICKEHGMFEQRPNDHLKGQGCKKCASIRCSKNYIKTTEEFLEDIEKVHSDKYEYPKLNYKGSNKNITIICKVHGEFKQKAAPHLRGQGCPKCASEYVGKLNSSNSSGWNYNNWKKAGERSKQFESYKVYIIKCWNENEEFYKIEKTFLKLENRFPSKKSMPYNHDIIKMFKGEAREICELERELQKQNKENKYKPEIIFGGSFECFTKII